jgi:hypothetical protein
VPFETLQVRPTTSDRTVIDERGVVRHVPDGWSLLPPGDPAISRRIKKVADTWVVTEMKGNKRFSRGIWAPAEQIKAIENELYRERANPAYQKKLDSAREKRALAEEVYGADFRRAVMTFLNFHRDHRETASAVARLVTHQAIPVGSRSVARTKRIPLETRAEAATIAWLRHQTTDYDTMAVPHIKGSRREIRHELAQSSRELLARYRAGNRIDKETCRLQRALRKEAALQEDFF